MTEKYIMINMNDERTGKIAEIMSNKTSKKILSLISESEKELSETDLSLKLKIPLNTVDYNIKKLLSAGLVEKASNWWSVKGRRIETYKPANKKIIISTKMSYKGILSSALLFGAVGFVTNVFKNIFNASRSLYASNNILEKTAEIGAGSSTGISSSYEAASAGSNLISANSDVITFGSLFHNAWLWILCGIVIGAILFFVYKKTKELKGGSIGN